MDEPEQGIHLLETFDEIIERIYDPDLEPDPKRSDWSSYRSEVLELASLYENELLVALDSATPELEASIASALETRAGHIGLGVFAALRACGQVGHALPLLSRIAERSSRGDGAPFFEAANRDPDSAAELSRLRHRLANGHTSSRAELKRLAKTTTEKAIAARALATFHAPQPLTRAPGLATLNGFGTGLYGSRDRDRDGSTVKTLCLSALFVPVFPLSAYRVLDHGDGSYSFLSKNRLSRFARGYRIALLASLVAAICAVVVTSYLGSAGRLAGKDLAAADAMRDAGDTNQATLAYEDLVRKWADRADDELVSKAAGRAFELRASAVPSPLTIESVEQAMAVLRSYQNYPFAAKSEANSSAVVARVLSWADELGGESTAALGAVLPLLELGAKIARPEGRGEIKSKRRDIKTKLARNLVARRPLEALEMLVELGADDEANAVLAKILEHPSLLIEAATDVETWLARSGGAGAPIRDALDRAIDVRDDPDRVAAIASGELTELEAALKKHPKDHAVATAIANLERGTGNPDAAIARLSALGSPGWLTGRTQEALAAALVQAEQLEKADAVLSELLEFRLPRYRATADAYSRGAGALRERLGNAVDQGRGPPDIQSALRAGNEAAAVDGFNRWVSEEMAKDPKLTALRVRHQDNAYLVTASVALGTIKLRRAARAGGAAKQALLSKAEHAFLAISGDAVGLPSYHLGLGRVYHRTGRPDDGDAEFASLLERKDPELGLAVSSAYRDLGLSARAIEVAEAVWRESSSPIRELAAHQISIFADDLATKEEWLERADQSSPAVEATLLQVRGRRAANKGNDKEAARLFSRVAAFWEKTAKHNATAANNAAIAYLELYSATHNDRHLSRARRGFEASLKLDPQHPLVAGNLAQHCEFEGWLRVLTRVAGTKSLGLESADVERITGRLLNGPLREKLLRAARREPILRRGSDLNDQELVLAPNAARGWERAVTQAGLFRDAGRLNEIASQLEGIAVDTSQHDASMARWRDGDSDALYYAELATDIKRLETMVASASERRAKKAEAVSRYLLAESLSRRGWPTLAIDDLEAAHEEAKTATSLWPAFGDTTSTIELRLMVARAAGTSPDVVAVHTENWRDLDVVAMLLSGLASERGKALRAALGPKRSLSAIGASLARDTAGEPSSMHWLLGELLGDSELKKRGEEMFDSPGILAETKAWTKLTPTSQHSRQLLRFIETRGKLRAADISE